MVLDDDLSASVGQAMRNVSGASSTDDWSKFARSTAGNGSYL
jgi:hypothetical protein